MNLARAEEAERRDVEKERRWGPGWRKETGAGTGRGGGGGGKDRKGYYKLLGLHAKMGSATLVRGGSSVVHGNLETRIDCIF
jgi:hypothetical protein